MSLIAILICLAVQRYLKFNSSAHQWNWAEPYYRWMSEKIHLVDQGHGLLGVLILVAPVLIIVALVFAILHHLLGLFVCLIFSIALLWYCIDASDLRQEPHSKANAKQLLLFSYHRLFAPLFWFFLLGPIGLVLYVSVMQLSALLEKAEQKPENLFHYMLKAQAVLDWVPMRLLGLSFALVGHFGTVFKSWFANLLTGLQDSSKHLVAWGKAALSRSEAGDGEADEMVDLIDRAILVWLVVMALVTIGMVFGY